MAAKWFCCCKKTCITCNKCRLLESSGTFVAPCTGNMDIRWNDGVDYYTPSNNTSNDATLTWDGTDYPMNGVDIVTVAVTKGTSYPYTISGTFSADVGINLFDPDGNLLSGIRPVTGVAEAEFWCDLSAYIADKSYWFRVVGKMDCCDPLSDLHNTGEDLSIGDDDPNYSGTPTPKVVDEAGANVFDRWFNPDTSISQWISVYGSTAGDFPTPATDTYSTTFTSSSDTATLNFRVMYDNCLMSIRLNSTEILHNESCINSFFGPGPDDGFLAWREFTFRAPDGLIVGSNTLEFDIRNRGDVAGFRLEWCPNDDVEEEMGMLAAAPASIKKRCCGKPGLRKVQKRTPGNNPGVV